MQKPHNSYHILLSILLILFLYKSLGAQENKPQYAVNKHLFIASTLACVGSHIYGATYYFEPLDDFKDVDKNELNSFDRSVILNNSRAASKMSDKLLYTSYSLPLLLLAAGNNKPKWNVLLVGLQGYYIADVLNQMVKIHAERPRPYIYKEGEIMLHAQIQRNDLKSFYSGHTSSAAYWSFFTLRVFLDHYPHSRFKPLFWTAAVILPAATGYLRVEAGKHFPTDVIIGFLSGAAIGYFTPKIFTSTSTSLHASPTGLAFHYRF